MGFLGTRRWMSELGQSRRFGDARTTSALPLIADIRIGTSKTCQQPTLRVRSECAAGALFGLTGHSIEGSAQRGKRRWFHKHINMVETRDEFNCEIRLCGLQRRGVAIDIELVVIATCNECH